MPGGASLTGLQDFSQARANGVLPGNLSALHMRGNQTLVILVHTEQVVVVA